MDTYRGVLSEVRETGILKGAYQGRSCRLGYIQGRIKEGHGERDTFKDVLWKVIETGVLTGAY